MKLTHYILYILVAGVVFSCAPKIDPIFDDTSANRIEEEMETVQEILLSSPNGWLMDIIPLLRKATEVSMSCSTFNPVTECPWRVKRQVQTRPQSAPTP